MYAYKLSTVNFILLVEWTGQIIQCYQPMLAWVISTSKWAIILGLARGVLT